MKTRANDAFTLVEVALAAGIAAFCLLTLFALLPLSLQQAQTAGAESTAANLARALEADLRAAPNAAQQSPRYGFVLPTRGREGADSIQTVFMNEAGAGSPLNEPSKSAEFFRVSLWFGPLAAPAQHKALSARIVISWPAQADPDPASAPSRYSGSFETVLFLEREEP